MAMPISGTLLNVVTVVMGATLGLLVGGRLPERLHGTIMGGLGLGTLLIGMQMALATSNVLILLGSILVGGVVGELLRLDYHLDNLGNYLQRRLAGTPTGTPAGAVQKQGGKDLQSAGEGGEDSEGHSTAGVARPLQALQTTDPKPVTGSSTFSEAFVTSSIVFCVGPMTLLGSIQNGISGDITLLAIKSTLDGFAAFAFAAALGWGVMMSAVTVLVYQGAISLAAWWFVGGLADCPGLANCHNPYILEMTAAGGLIVLGVGLKLLDIRDLRLANYLPALAVAPLIVWVVQHWPLR
jgi:uncharacterized membrane protein YqgA involved in biofilm formation